MAGAYTTGWAQRRVQNALAQQAAINGLFGTATDPRTNVLASAQSFEASAGSPVSIRWGYNDPNNVLSTGLATNTVVADLRIYYENQSTNLWETAATDTLSQTGAAGAQTLDRTLTFTPTHTGTFRIFVRLHVTVTVGGANVNDINTDGGNQFGSPVEAVAATVTLVDFTYGLVRGGTTLNSLTLVGIRVGSLAFYPDSIQDSLVTGHAPRFADGIYTILWQSPSGTTFFTQSIAAGTSTTLTDTSTQVSPLNSFPASAAQVTEVLQIANSALSMANSGVGLPWVHFSSAPSTPGTVTTSLDASGTIVGVTFTNAWIADPRLQIHCHTQKATPLSKDTPDTPTFTDIDFFIISADVFKGWMHAANNAVPPEDQSGITGNMHLSDPTFTSPTNQNTSQGAGDNINNMGATGADGWIASGQVFSFTPIPPAGQWHYYAANVTASGGKVWMDNYIIRQDDNKDSMGGFSGFKGVNFVSAYRDNIIVRGSLKAPTESKIPKPGDTVQLIVSVFKTSGVVNANPLAYHFDGGTMPTMKITRWNPSTNQLEYWTPIGTPPITTDPGTVLFSTGFIIDGSTLNGLYTMTWTVPSTAPNGVYVLLFGSSVDGGDKYFALPILISSDLTNPVFDGVDFATGFPFR